MEAVDLKYSTTDFLQQSLTQGEITLTTIFEPSASVAQAPQFNMDMAKASAFMNRVMADLSGTLVSILCSLGDRLGLFKALAAYGPVTCAEFAGRAGINERYAREWLSALACAGYLEYDPSTQRFALPLEHALVLAQERGMMFMGGAYQQIPGLMAVLDQVAQAFRHGGGIPQSSYNRDLRQGMERMSATWFENLLVQQWLPTVPDVLSKLDRGIQVADIGCGGGWALIKLAQAFPNSRYVGYDGFALAIDVATANANSAGMSDHVRFEQRNVMAGLPDQYDLITTFDSVHDFANPLQGLQAIRQSLRPDGTYLLLEMNCADKLEENFGPAGTILYSTSVLYNTPVSLADGGAGLGTMGLPESKIRQLCTEAGFSSIRRLPIENPFNILYEVKP
ncbi:putative SAM dependent methyltransferase [Tolypothrix sp. PCC 7601]|uniref:class I SAM-dependent methyltransferase n=1 Tax=Tolypothrix sp. PCC 7712 TaxID=2596898 RepID=UPI0005EAA6C9|nr:methyltransferase domain-containing protein [Tolypothrix sp. PCC 7712]EKF04538.1 putative SAM dependent methyltransferase [Tolypothrix sp. PCC 7601]